MKRKTRALIVMTMTLLLIAGLVSLSPASKVAAASTSSRLHGANLAWLDGQYGHDIGTNFLFNWGCSYNHSHMQKYFQDMRKMNLNIVRIWLFENLEGLKFDSGDNVSGLDATLITNLRDTIAIAKANNIQLYLTLLNGCDVNSFEFPLSADHQTLRNRLINIIQDPGKRATYLNNAVGPLAAAFKGESQIYAFDVINECEGAVTGADGNIIGPGVSWDTMRSFILGTVTKIKSADATRQVTSTSGWHDWNNVMNGKFSGLGLDFYDFHVYDSAGYIPEYSTLNLDKPAILGEYGQKQNTSWDDTLQNDATRNFLTNCRNKGYDAGSLIWTYGYAGSTEIFNGSSHKSVGD
ncbi:MAG: hypothetical protein CVT63_06595 [Candidatus Anoxymicrobium japonicum]|uniref:Glycoside hydrolase family 5 domain-containing protein n=1 Tax=Candidatus Anoxymicrobium japonicum TaxID=2013648 RepID=A0A2N3G4P8_9ACTN|nr:MAG: hypothetical protein CVT63_06595 [Candidatus Anoxymicrobium japonicum]